MRQRALGLIAEGEAAAVAMSNGHPDPRVPPPARTRAALYEGPSAKDAAATAGASDTRRPRMDPLASLSASRRDVDKSEAESWQRTPHFTTSRAQPAPLPTYVFRNRRLAQVDVDRPAGRAVRVRSDVTRRVAPDRYDRAELQAAIARGDFRRKKSDISVSEMLIKYSHRTPMKQDPGRVGTLRMAPEDVNRAGQAMAGLHLAELLAPSK
jgi:hypothetical protein